MFFEDRVRKMYDTINLEYVAISNKLNAKQLLGMLLKMSACHIGHGKGRYARYSSLLKMHVEQSFIIID